MKLIDCLEGNITEYEIEYRVHATRRMFQRDIYEDDVELILTNGEVIERYEEDYPLPTLLLFGKAATGRPLHVVVGMNFSERKLVIITTYEPDPQRWSADFTRRLP